MKPPRAEELHTIVSKGRFDRAVAILNRLDPLVAADAFMGLQYEEQRAFFRRLPIGLAAKLTAILPYYHSFVLLHTLPFDEMVSVLEKMNPIERTNFIEELPEEQWEQIVRELETKQQIAAPPAEETRPTVPAII